MSGTARRLGGVFIDTHALLAAINADDAHHSVASRHLEQLTRRQTPLFTSDWVLSEFLSAAARRPLRAPATKAVMALAASPLTTIVEADRATWAAAFDLYRSRKDKTWSLVDCTTIVLCESLRIRRVLTHDHHFTQAGLEIMIP